MMEISDNYWKIVIDTKPFEEYPNYGKYHAKIVHKQGLYGIEMIMYEGWYNSITEANKEMMKAKQMFAI